MLGFYPRRPGNLLYLTIEMVIFMAKASKQGSGSLVLLQQQQPFGPFIKIHLEDFLFWNLTINNELFLLLVLFKRCKKPYLLPLMKKDHIARVISEAFPHRLLALFRHS